ncbi:MAG: hypothetical protein EXS05_04665 [Planctomycetaceae bacterium]|nr:hypothetical protein [Planctomycetaceae bacterium]
MSTPQIRWLAALVCLAAAGGCRQYGHAETGALVGGGLGTMAGAIVGSESGHAGAGALIGAATGAVAGGIVGDAADAREERDAAVAHAQYHQAQARFAAHALSTDDVVAMKRNGVGDDVIVHSIRNNGCRFSGDPHSIINLKQAGVSDRVIEAMQTSAAAGPPAAVVYDPTPRYGGSPPVVVVAPRPYAYPYPYYYGGPRGRPWGPPGPYGHRGYW